ncbi:MAG: ornithine--oxo-acid transaminase [Burkholderiaceae bacterium]
MSTSNLSLKPLQLIGVANALGCRQTNVAAAPEALQNRGLCGHLRRNGLAAGWGPLLHPMADQPSIAALADLAERTAQQVEASIAMHVLPVVIGGDHSTALGTWRGVGRALRTKGSFGLLWLDAHLDAHTLSTTPSGNLHGMPVALLMGQGHPKLVGVAGPHLPPENIVIYGARSWETAEWNSLNAQGARIYCIDEIRDRGVEETLREAIERLHARTDFFGVSIDLDVFDSAIVPFTTTPCAAGLDPQEIGSILASYKPHDTLCAIELVEYLPEHDHANAGVGLITDLITALAGPDTQQLRSKELSFGANNYDPLPAVFTCGEGVWLTDVQGHRVLDMMSAYSAVSFGHSHPRLIKALTDQARRLTLTSRAVSNDRLPLLLEKLCELTGMERALPMNTGTEAVETALKAARKWAYQVKGVTANEAEIIACENNFHGRSTLIVGLSSEPHYQDGFGPFPNGLKRVPFGDAAALEKAITPNTAAFIVEPIQGEGGIVVPPAGYLAACLAICRRHNVLLIVDEVQTGLGRTGALLACDHDGIRPDGLILGKALGGGLYPVSAFLGSSAVMGVFQPGNHGSTFGGNPLGAAVALEALDVLVQENLPQNAATLGDYLLRQLRNIDSPLIRCVRGRGLMVGMEIETRFMSAHLVAERLLQAGLLTKDTHECVLRFTPPLTITQETLDWACNTIEQTLKTLWREFSEQNDYLGKIFTRRSLTGS